MRLYDLGLLAVAVVATALLTGCDPAPPTDEATVPMEPPVLASCLADDGTPEPCPEPPPPVDRGQHSRDDTAPP